MQSELLMLIKALYGIYCSHELTPDESQQIGQGVTSNGHFSCPDPSQKTGSAQASPQSV